MKIGARPLPHSVATFQADSLPMTAATRMWFLAFVHWVANKQAARSPGMPNPAERKAQRRDPRRQASVAAPIARIASGADTLFAHN
jgi:hypothetical protein